MISGGDIRWSGDSGSHRSAWPETANGKFVVQAYGVSGITEVTRFEKDYRQRFGKRRFIRCDTEEAASDTEARMGLPSDSKMEFH